MSAPAWARGYPLEELRALADLYREHERGVLLGAFGATKEVQIAELMERGELLYRGGAAMAVARRSSAQPVKDFTGETRVVQAPGDVVISRLAGPARALWSMIEPLRMSGRQTWLETYIEHPATAELLELARRPPLEAVKIRASSELVGVWRLGPPLDPAARRARLDPADEATLVQLPVTVDALALGAALHQVEAVVSSWADHYSSYNKRHSWSALALQGYRDPASADAPEFQIVKPAEMSRSWQREHPDSSAWPVLPTELAGLLPAVLDLLGLLPGEAQRIRLMRLAPGGGELSRHADIIDREAGTADGHVARIHIPLRSNPEVRFRQWQLDGRALEGVMVPGSVWYLDTRKPHQAGNYGTTERIHLVSDIYTSEPLRELIRRGRSAPLVR